MTELLERAVDVTRNLPASLQDDIARMMLQIAGEELSPHPLGRDDEASFEESLRQAEHREFAAEADVSAIWAKHGL
ncbi:MAG: hypothetical protein KF914_19505 [Rhizobiaceae bacterium]|nr:hypothetical protein [Rhizobiaceae bacterium]